LFEQCSTPHKTYILGDVGQIQKIQYICMTMLEHCMNNRMTNDSGCIVFV